MEFMEVMLRSLPRCWEMTGRFGSCGNLHHNQVHIEVINASTSSSNTSLICFNSVVPLGMLMSEWDPESMSVGSYCKRQIGGCAWLDRHETQKSFNSPFKLMKCYFSTALAKIQKPKNASCVDVTWFIHIHLTKYEFLSELCKLEHQKLPSSSDRTVWLVVKRLSELLSHLQHLVQIMVICYIDFPSGYKFTHPEQIQNDLFLQIVEHSLYLCAVFNQSQRSYHSVVIFAPPPACYFQLYETRQKTTWLEYC